MPVLETVLIYGVVPLAAVLILAVLTLLPGRGKDKTRYRPGQPWEHEAVWYEPHPDVPGVPGHGDDHGTGHAVAAHTGARALTAGIGATAAALALGEHPHTTHEADAPRRSAAGGARGTW
ncbi:hypothetical protein [Modestobacter sp. SSW1-42]|uniref:aa3-type cytochrome oxidase subunit CtaJ n=1 Tax=Modestobacter sp. SSW1-42 TaxID=596372 RepID=UPI0039870BE8